MYCFAEYRPCLKLKAVCGFIGFVSLSIFMRACVHECVFVYLYFGIMVLVVCMCVCVCVCILGCWFC